VRGETALEQILRHPAVWRGDRGVGGPRDVVPTGFAALDAALPGGGWPRGALLEVLAARQGIGELSLLVPALGALSREGRRLAWVDPPYVPYAPALTSRGIDLEGVLLVRTDLGEEGLWAAEQALRSGACGAVLAWPRESLVDGRALRRLQLAAESGSSWGVLFRPARRAAEPSPAPVRVLLEPGLSGVVVSLLKCRGRGPAGPVWVRPQGRPGGMR
jgi:hypothetical protein